MKLGNIIILSGPSGVGKSTLIKAIRKELPDLRFSVSCTTRAPRTGEVNDVDYHFLTREEFLKRKANNEFVETAEVFANFYGTLKSEVLAIAEKGENVLLDIDVQGALQIKEACKIDSELARCCEFIFIVPPSLEELERRLRGRATDSEEQISLRLGKAKHELSFWGEYSYIIANNDIECAASELLSVIKNFSLQSKKFTKEPF